jgi:hypothetical protein
MKLVRALSLVSVGCFVVGGSVWLGCGGDDSVNGVDSGSPEGSTDDGSADTNAADTSNPRDAGDAAISLDCTSYCTAIQKDCKDMGTGGSNLQYLDDGTCLKMCAAIPLGASTDTSGDTLGCRIYHVGLATKGLTSAERTKNLATHCPHAGPYGYGGCGGMCEDFCARYVTQCGASAYDGGAFCPIDCAAFPSVDAGFIGITTGNSIECREYHLENAYAYDAGPDGSGGGHCTHAGASGGGICQ